MRSILILFIIMRSFGMLIAGELETRGNVIDGRVLEFSKDHPRPSACRSIFASNGECYILAQYVPVLSGVKMTEIILYRIYEKSWVLIYYGRFDEKVHAVNFDGSKNEVSILGVEGVLALWCINKNNEFSETSVELENVIKFKE